MGGTSIYDRMQRRGLNDAFCHRHSGWVTDAIAKSCQAARATQDRRALRGGVDSDWTAH
jgi:hypothetical protein